MQSDRTETTDTSEGCLRSAFQALLRGDTAERDRLCERAKILLKTEQHAAAVERVMQKDFYVTRAGTCIPIAAMAKAAGVLQ